MSNGTLINEEKSLKIAKVFDEVRISIDGFHEVNDKVRGEGVFQKSCRAIRYLRFVEVILGISITVTSQSLGQLCEFLKFIYNEMHVSKFHITPLKLLGRGTKHSELTCSYEEVQKEVSRFWQEQIRVKTGFEKSNDKSKEPINCGIGYYINILPDGSVYPCHSLSIPEFYLGNVKQISLIDMLEKSPIFNNLKNLNFVDLRKRDEKFKLLIEKYGCLGEIYHRKPEELVRLSNSALRHFFFKISK